MDIIELLQKMVEINSVYPYENELGLFLYDYLSKEGFKVEKQEVEGKRFNILAEKGKGKNALLFLGHLDTVPPATAWSTNPFKLIESGNKLYGLGSFDMKGGLAAMLKAAERMKGGKIKILLCADEENISKGAWNAVKNRKEWFHDVDFIISAEPPVYSGVKYDQGINVITVGRGGRVVISVEVEGRSSHQARAEEGINAIEEASKIVNAIREIPMSSHSNLGTEHAFVRKIGGQSEGLSVPEKASIEIDIRLVPPTTVADAKDRVEELIGKLQRQEILNREARVKVSIKERETPYLQPYSTDTNNPLFKKAIKVIRDEIGELIITYGRSVSDENVLANELKLPLMRLGPKGGNAHAADEWVSKSSLGQLAKLYELLIENH